MKALNLFFVLALSLGLGLKAFAHGGDAHSHDDYVVEGDEAHEYHEDGYVELGDDPVYGVPAELVDELDDDERDEVFQPETLGGRLFVDSIEGQYLRLKKGEVVITIDDGPTPNVTAAVVRLLDEYNIRGVFFVVGNRVKRYPRVMDVIAGSGHIIGNHTYNHELDFSTPQDMFNSMTRSNQVTRDYVSRSGQTRCYVRTPGGVWNNWRKSNLNQHSVLRQCIGPFYWNIGGGKSNADWNCWSRGVSAQQCADGYYRELLKKGKGIILAHDLNRRTEPFLRALFGKMQREGIKNKNGSGFWDFKDLDQLSVLDNLEVSNPAPL